MSIEFNEHDHDFPRDDGRLSVLNICKLGRNNSISKEIIEAASLFENEEDETGLEGDGIVFTYYDLNGKVFKYRLGLRNPIGLKDGKKIKYLEKSGNVSSPYFLLNDLNDILNIRKTLYVVEGEKKLLSLKSMDRNLTVISFPGAHNWTLKGSNGELSQMWDEIPVQGREIILIPDTDMFVNPQVYLGYSRFIIAMIKKGACVKLIDLRTKDVA